jgi:hypothetical protein
MPDFFENMPKNKDAPSGQSFKLSEGIPPLPEDMVPFYESYIPVKLKGKPDQIEAARAALAARNQILLENILNPTPYDTDPSAFQPRSAARGLSEEEEIELMRDLGYDV